MTHPQHSPSREAMVVQRLEVGLRTYENRYTLCHRRNCSVCYGRQEDYVGPPGHGPYWYLCVTTGRQWTRIYIGKTLDTSRFILPDGSIDWAQIRERRRARIKARKEKKEITPCPAPSSPTG